MEATSIEVPEKYFTAGQFFSSTEGEGALLPPFFLGNTCACGIFRRKFMP